MLNPECAETCANFMGKQRSYLKELTNMHHLKMSAQRCLKEVTEP